DQLNGQNACTARIIGDKFLILKFAFPDIQTTPPRRLMEIRSMLSSKQRVFQLLILVLLAVFGQPQSVRSQSERPESNTTCSGQRSFLTQYCFGCHNERTKTAGLMLDKMD